MNIGLEEETKTIQEIDKKIIIKYYKLKNKAKTRLYGLEDFIDEKETEKLMKNVKKKLGCGGTLTEDENKIKNIEFQGDQREHIKEILISNTNISAEKIFLKGA